MDAFVARFGRLQDTLADKLLPALLRQLAEPVRSAVENLDRAEKLGLLQSADDWLAMRRLAQSHDPRVCGRPGATGRGPDGWPPQGAGAVARCSDLLRPG